MENKFADRQEIMERLRMYNIQTTNADGEFISLDNILNQLSYLWGRYSKLQKDDIANLLVPEEEKAKFYFFMDCNKKKTTFIISAFPGSGKSYAYKKLNSEEYKILDSDFSNFTKLDFPNNYINYINSQIDKVDIIFTSSSKEVIDELEKNDINFILVYPEKRCKIEYINRYKLRGNSEAFIKKIEENWDEWIDEYDQRDCHKLILKPGEFILDYLE